MLMSLTMARGGIPVAESVHHTQLSLCMHTVTLCTTLNSESRFLGSCGSCARTLRSGCSARGRRPCSGQPPQTCATCPTCTRACGPSSPLSCVAWPCEASLRARSFAARATQGLDWPQPQAYPPAWDSRDWAADGEANLDTSADQVGTLSGGEARF